MSFENIRRTIASGAAEITVNIDGRKIEAVLDVSDRQRKVLLAGGILNQGGDHDLPGHRTLPPSTSSIR